MTTAKKHRFNLLAILFFGLWVLYLGLAGPWLVSEASTLAVIVGFAIGVALLAATYHWLTKPTTPKGNNQ